MTELLSLFPPGSTIDDDGTLVVGGCRADDLAAEFGTPVLVVAEQALRSRAREYVDELTARWASSRVVFASKAFPCTAVQRVMVEEGLGLDVAGGGEILTALKAGVDPGLIVHHGNAKSDEEIALAVEHGVGLVVVDNSDDVDRLEATVPEGHTQDVLVRVIPGVTADTHAHVLTGHEGSKFGLSPDTGGAVDPAHRTERTAAHARSARARGVADPRRRTVRGLGGTRGRTRRVPGLRPRRRARISLHVGRHPTVGRRLPRRTASVQRASTCPRRHRSSSSRDGAWSASPPPRSTGSPP